MTQRTYHVYLDDVEIGTTALEFADPPMGVVYGRIAFLSPDDPFVLFSDYCRTHNVVVNEKDPILGFIDTMVIPGLNVYRSDGLEIVGVGNHITGMTTDGYMVTILGVPYPFYGEEFPHHRSAYEEKRNPKDE